MEFKIGKLYKCFDYRLLLHFSEETARAALFQTSLDAVKIAVTAPSGNTGPFWAKHWSERLGCKVCFSEPEEVFLALGQKNNFIHILAGEKVGWIVIQDFLEIERVL